MVDWFGRGHFFSEGHQALPSRSIRLGPRSQTANGTLPPSSGMGKAREPRGVHPGGSPPFVSAHGTQRKLALLLTVTVLSALSNLSGATSEATTTVGPQRPAYLRASTVARGPGAVGSPVAVGFERVLQPFRVPFATVLVAASHPRNLTRQRPLCSHPPTEQEIIRPMVPPRWSTLPFQQAAS